MMTDTNPLAAELIEIARARAITHRAVQHLTRAARANLEPQPDDSHSNLGWDARQTAFLSQPIDGKLIGLSMLPLTLFIAEGGERLEALALCDVSDSDAGQWLDEKLAEYGLSAGSAVTLPYELPEDVFAVDCYEETPKEHGLTALAEWFDSAAAALEQIVADNSDVNPGPSPVRCWPHHFDIATYVALETGNPETARGIGVGMSPGDEGYNEPYFYVNPWPHFDVKSLPDAIAPGHWHVEGYVGMIATASEILSASDGKEGIASFVAQSFAVARKAQGYRDKWVRHSHC